MGMMYCDQSAVSAFMGVWERAKASYVCGNVMSCQMSVSDALPPFSSPSLPSPGSRHVAEKQDRAGVQQHHRQPAPLVGYRLIGLFRDGEMTRTKLT